MVKGMYSFDNIIGNERIIHSLKTAIQNNRLNHAYIFDGARGSGKHTIANTFAKTLNCEEGSLSPCGRCISCETFESGNNPDIIYVRRGFDKNGKRRSNIVVDDVREYINKNVEIKPYRNRYKIFIIEDADLMNVEAQNAFLKTLEEPPEYAVFLLLAENYNRFLVTVLSRCQRFSMHNIPTKRISAYLISNNGISAENAQIAALYAQGSIGRAAELASSEEFNTLRNEAISYTIRLLETDLIGLYRITAEMDNYKAEIESFLDIMYLLYRDSLVYSQTGSEDKVIQKDKIQDIKRLCALTNTKRLIKGCELIEQATDNLRKRGDFQFVIENLFFKLKEK